MVSPNSISPITDTDYRQCLAMPLPLPLPLPKNIAAHSPIRSERKPVCPGAPKKPRSTSRFVNQLPLPLPLTKINREMSGPGAPKRKRGTSRLQNKDPQTPPLKKRVLVCPDAPMKKPRSNRPRTSSSLPRALF